MQIESTKGDEYKVWLTDTEIDELRRATTSPRDDLIIQLRAYVGLRAFEIPQVRPAGVKESNAGQYRLRVEAGKDTGGNGGKPRDAFLPDSVERDLQRFQTPRISRRTTRMSTSHSPIRAVVNRTADRAAEATGERDFRKVSTHDLRRRFAQRLLVDEGMNPRVVITVGGWDSFAAIEPYLKSPSEGVVDEVFQKISL